jgi:16S rRNA (guanine966-N2)-methyltransferase
MAATVAGMTRSNRLDPVAMKRPSGKLRIIGGEYRSRLVDFDPGAGVRPTPDRVRQTLFDWLAPLVPGARCIDLFAGSGALGLEALSRGAGHVTFVETGAAQARAIRAALERLGCAARAEVVAGDALSFIASAGAHVFDCAFLDPPFDSGLLAPALAALPRVLKPGARVYAEWHRDGPLPWPAGYAVLREKKAGQVSYALATPTGTGTSA